MFDEADDESVVEASIVLFDVQANGFEKFRVLRRVFEILTLVLITACDQIGIDGGRIG